MKTKRKPGRPADPRKTGVLTFWPLRAPAGLKVDAARRASELHTNVSATVRAAIRKGLPLVTMADVLEESR